MRAFSNIGRAISGLRFLRGGKRGLVCASDRAACGGGAGNRARPGRCADAFCCAPAGEGTRRARLVWRVAAAFLALVVAVGAGEVAIGALSGEKLVTPFGWGIVRVLSGSMEPTFSEGSLLVVSRVASSDEVSAGDIVVYDAGRSLVAHRVVEVAGDAFVTQGDANNVSDERIGLSRVKAKVVAWTPPLSLPDRMFGTASVSARYATRAQGADAARAARFAWDVQPSAPDGSELAVRPGEAAVVGITASNTRGVQVSEVPQICTIDAVCEGDVPLELSFEEGDSSREDETSAACTSAAFSAGEAESRIFPLVASLSPDADAAAFEGVESHVRVTVAFEQTRGEAGLIAGVEARYAHQETLDFTVRVAPSALQ